MSKDRARVLIVSDHPIMRAGLRLAIERQSDLQVAGEVTDGFSAVTSIKEMRPHVVLIDLPTSEREAALTLIWDLLPSLPAVALTELESNDERRATGTSKAIEVPKTASGEIILESIRSALRNVTSQ